MRTVLSKFIVTMLTCMLVLTGASIAQNPPVITVAMPIITDNIPNDLFADFEAQYGVRVVLESALTEVYLPHPSGSVEEHLQALQAYAQSADVIFVDSNTLSMAGAQSGFLLDLQPLAASDMALNVNDYHPAAWQSYLWDGQLWALPIAYNPVVMAYNPSAFDAVNLPYPSPSWTLNDYANAIRTLTQRDENGTVIQPGYEQAPFDMQFLAALANTSLADTAQFPAAPNFNNPALVEAMTVWKQLRNEGAVGQATDNMANIINTIQVTSVSSLYGTSANIALLPMTRAGIETGAVAVSSGTAQPELAYQLARYITTQQPLFDALYDALPANQTLMPNPNLPAHLQSVINEAQSVMQPAHTMRYSIYANNALTSEADAASALANAQQQALNDLQTARTIGQQTTIAVEESMFARDGVVLSFGVMTTTAPLPNQAEWERVADTFASANSDIAGVMVEAAFVGSLDELNQYDCYLTTSNRLDAMDTSLVLPIEPLTTQDANFNPNDFVAGTLDAMRHDGMIMGYPLTLQPRLLQADSVQFGNAGIVVDTQQWTVNQFGDAAAQWQRSTNTPIYQISNSADMMTLIAAYGGLPLDYSTNPATPNFLAPQNITATQQVFDMARNGQIAYSEFIVPPSFGGSQQGALRQAIFGANISSQLVPNAQLLHFPAGNQYAPVVYSVASGFISRQSQNADACYRWLAHISQSGTLFGSMPVRRSVLQNPNVQAALGVERTQLYANYEALLQQPNTVRIPRMGATGNSDSFVLQSFFNMAADAYVVDGTPLQDALSQAQSNADAYLQCRNTGATVPECALGVAPAIEVVIN